MKMGKRLLPVIALGLCGTVVSAATMTTIVSDTFSDGDRNNDGTLERSSGAAADTLDIPWFRDSSSDYLKIANDTGTGTHGGFALDMTPGGNINVGTLYSVGPNTYVSQAAVSSVTLGTQVGDAIRLTMNVRFSAYSGTSGVRWFRFGLYDSNTTPLTGDVFSGANDVGYWVNVPVSSNTAKVALYKDTATTDGMFVGSTALTPASSASSQTADGDFTVHTMRLTLERLTAGAAGNVGLSFYFDNLGVAVHSATDASSPLTTFDQIVIQRHNGAKPLVDNVILETIVVPEPAALSLLGLGGLALLRRRR